jgi:glucoamylase
VWAHAEYVKLRRSIEDGRVFDQPPQTVQRYLIEGRANTPYAVWRFNNKIRTMPPGKILRVETLARATVHWGINEWSDVLDVETVDTGLGVYFTDLATDRLASGDSVRFTFFWPDASCWEAVDFQVSVEPPGPQSIGKRSVLPF